MTDSVERYTIQPIPPRHVSPSDVKLYGEPHPFLIVVGWIAVWLLVGWLFSRITWLPQLVIATFITGFAVHQWREYCRKKQSNRTNDVNHEQAVKEASGLTQSVRGYYLNGFKCVDDLRLDIGRAHTCIQRANHEYSSNAASLFWDEIEQVALQLVQYRTDYESLVNYAKWYEGSLRGRSHNFPPFPIRPEMVPSLQPTLIAFQQTLRLGQTNSHFTLIWETIRTRAVLVEGFKTMNDVAQQLSARVEQSLRDMEHQLSTLSRNAAS